MAKQRRRERVDVEAVIRHQHEWLRSNLPPSVDPEWGTILQSRLRWVTEVLSDTLERAKQAEQKCQTLWAMNESLDLCLRGAKGSGPGV